MVFFGGFDVYLLNIGCFFYFLFDLFGINGDMVFFVELLDGIIWLIVNGKCWKIEGVIEGFKMVAEVEWVFFVF